MIEYAETPEPLKKAIERHQAQILADEMNKIRQEWDEYRRRRIHEPATDSLMFWLYQKLAEIRVQLKGR